MRKFNIQRPDHSLRTAIQDKIDNPNKPRGSLGVLEELAMQICLVQHTLSPALHRPHHLLLAGDHGITDEGVSVSPRAVTWQQMVNFTRDGGGVRLRHNSNRLSIRVHRSWTTVKTRVATFSALVKWALEILRLRASGQVFSVIFRWQNVSEPGRDSTEPASATNTMFYNAQWHQHIVKRQKRLSDTSADSRWWAPSGLCCVRPNSEFLL